MKPRLWVGERVNIEAADALLLCLHEAAGNVALIRSQLGEFTGELSQKERNEANSLYARYSLERDRLAAVAVKCLMAGMEERRVRLQEDYAQGLVSVLHATLGRLGVPITDEVGVILSEELMLVAAEAVAG